MNTTDEPTPAAPEPGPLPRPTRSTDRRGLAEVDRLHVTDLLTAPAVPAPRTAGPAPTDNRRVGMTRSGRTA